MVAGKAIKHETNVLVGMKAIRAYYPRSEKTIIDLIEHHGFPAVKVAGAWEADKVQIDEWRRNVIRGLDKDKKAGI